MQPGSSGADRPRPPALVAHGVMLAVWLTAAIVLGGWAALSDRVPVYQVLFTAALAGLGLAVPLAVLQMAAPWLGRLAPALASASCILFAAGLSLDLLHSFRVLGSARLPLLGVCVALAAWHLRRLRFSRLGLGAAMGVMCLAWILCGVLRHVTDPGLKRFPVLLPLLAGIAVLAPGLPVIDPSGSRLRRYLTLAAAAVLVLLAAQGPPGPSPTVVAGGPAASATAGGRSAIVIVLDTLRRDHMSLYGYGRKTTPALEQKARSGLVFDDATSVSAWTLPAHASMFTGLWPRTHGAHPFPLDKQHPVNIVPLAQEHTTLAEIAREHGYLTGGLSANHFYLGSAWGMSQGFAEYLCRRPRLSSLALRRASRLARAWDARQAVYADKPYFTAPEMTRAAIAWLRRHQDVPFLLFVNYMDPHVPNATPGTQGLPFEDEAFRYRLDTNWTPGDRPRARRSAAEAIR